MYVIFNSVLSHGHLNLCITIGRELLHRGHRVSFTVNDEWMGKLAAQGFEELLLDVVQSKKEEEKDGNSANLDLDLLKGEVPDFWKHSWRNPDFYERHKGEALALFGLIDQMKEQDEQLGQLMMRQAPDVILVDHLFKHPYLERIGNHFKFDAKSLSFDEFCEQL